MALVLDRGFESQRDLQQALARVGRFGDRAVRVKSNNVELIDPKLITQSLETKNIIEKNIIKLLEENNVAFDIGSYRSAPPGLRIWGGPTVDNDDLKKLLPWLDWAYHKSFRDLDI